MNHLEQINRHRGFAFSHGASFGAGAVMMILLVSRLIDPDGEVSAVRRYLAEGWAWRLAPIAVFLAVMVLTWRAAKIRAPGP